MPEISVIMSVYNNQDYLKDAIESILNQTAKDFEFIIINDASTDNSLKIIESYKDPRIKIINNEKNLGISASSNKGLRLAQGKYIARMDGDDISDLTRFEKQLDYLKKHPSISIISSNLENIDCKSKHLSFFTMPNNHWEIKWISLFRTPFIHGGVMLSRKLIEEHQIFYNETYKTAEDYDWFQNILEYASGSNIKEYLLKYRRHQASSTHNPTMLANFHREIFIKAVRKYYPTLELSDKELSLFSDTYKTNTTLSYNEIKICTKVNNLLLKAFFEKNRSSMKLSDVIAVKKAAAGPLFKLVLLRGRAIKNPLKTIYFLALAKELAPYCILKLCNFNKSLLKTKP